ncbi:MAG: hypothetical protein K1X74_12830 [Pirellulales bacterium]|nr:hypothetical protein [Pirellulales bacterium]
MLLSVIRSVVAIVLALAVAFGLVIAVEYIGTILHPLPAGFDPNDAEACRAYAARLPTSALVVAVVGWALAVGGSSWIATRLGAARHPAHGIAIGLLLFAAALANMAMVPYPFWFRAVNTVLLPLCLILGARWARRLAAPPVAA